MEENLERIGEAGKVIHLKKECLKPGKKSKTKPGNERKVHLHRPLIVGHPVIERILIIEPMKKGKFIGHKITNDVEKIKVSTNGEFIIETVTSIYSVVFL